MRYNFKRYCKNYQGIENFEKAKKDDFVGWHCHHRLETHTPDGERRDVDISHKELIALGMYYNRPASELIFLPASEHNAYGKGKHRSEETKKKIREGNKGNKNALGHCVSEEAKKKIAEASKGNTNVRGRHWYNNGKENKYCYECPEGFTPGMLKREQNPY